MQRIYPLIGESAIVILTNKYKPIEGAWTKLLRPRFLDAGGGKLNCYIWPSQVSNDRKDGNSDELRNQPNPMQLAHNWHTLRHTETSA